MALPYTCKESVVVSQAEKMYKKVWDEDLQFAFGVCVMCFIEL